jgi:hypothetical protein
MEKSYESVIGQKEEIKKYFKEKYNLDFGKPIVSFFTNNVSEEQNYRLLKAFSSILSKNVHAFIKLRQGCGDQQKDYEKWLRELAPGINVNIIKDENPFELFLMSDILVTCQSVAALEALRFDVVSIVLDISEEIDLENEAPQNMDCLTVKSAEELMELFDAFLENPDYLEKLKIESRVLANKHFVLRKGGASRYIANAINAEAFGN